MVDLGCLQETCRYISRCRSTRTKLQKLLLAPPPLIEARPRHGYEISKLIEQRSGGAVRFCVASLYPLLYRLERRGWTKGRWVEKGGQRRRRYYRLTRQGRRVLASQLRGWSEFVAGINRITEAENA